jgi:hypothetical protein
MHPGSESIMKIDCIEEKPEEVVKDGPESDTEV